MKGSVNNSPSRPMPSVTGKPMAKMLICGATREMAPSTRFTNSRIVISGIAIHKPVLKISAPQRWGCIWRKKASGSGPMGKAWKLCTSAAITSRWPLMTMNSHATSVPKSRLVAVAALALMGSKKPAKFRPICRPTNSPANSTAANTSRTAKPSDSPITTCCTTSSTAVGESSATCAAGPSDGSDGCAASATKAASAMRTRVGTPRWPSTGSAVNSASARRKGHSSGVIQASAWASEKLIIRAKLACKGSCGLSHSFRHS